MPHFPKPYRRKDRKNFFVQIHGHQYNLGLDEDAAWQRYHELMAQLGHRPSAVKLAGEASAATPQSEQQSAATPSPLVSEVIQRFVAFVRANQAAATIKWYVDRLQKFLDYLTGHPDAAMGYLTVADLKNIHVREWVDAMAGVSSGTKRNYCRAVQRAMRWAEQEGIIDRSPLAHLKKPRAGRREVVVTPEEYRAILDLTRDEQFRDLLTVTWETGCRPQESLRVEARHVDLPNARWVFPATEAKTGVPRIVYLSDAALAITRRLVLRHPQGALFRNTDGAPWTTDAVNCRFQTIEKKLGKKFCLYHLRHTWMTRLLWAGCDSLTVSILAGHCDPSTMAKFYQHVSMSPEFLRNAARKFTA